MKKPKGSKRGVRKKGGDDFKITRAEFDRRIHFLDAEFKQSLRDHRWQWVVPEELDRIDNPILEEIPDAFDRVLTPEELDRLPGIVERGNESLISPNEVPLFEGLLSTRNLDGDFYKKKLRKKVGSKSKAKELLRVVEEFDLRLSAGGDEKEALAEARLQEKWEGFPQVYLCPGMDDLGESTGGRLVPWVMPLDLDFWEKRKDLPRDPRYTYGLPRRAWRPRRGAEGHFLIYLHPGIGTEDRNKMLRNLGITKEGSGSGTKDAVGHGKTVLRALRWWICQEMLRAKAKDDGWEQTALPDLIVQELEASDFAIPSDAKKGSSPDTVKNWWTRKGQYLKTAREKFGLSLKPYGQG